METKTKEKETQLTLVVDSSGVEKATASMLKEKFKPFFEQAEEWKQKAEALVVTDVTQVKEMADARAARLSLKNIRVSADKLRKELKQDSLRYGDAVQGVYKVIESLISPIEEHLEKQEKFAEEKQKELAEELKAQRLIKLKAFEPEEGFYAFNYDLANMGEQAFELLLSGAKASYDNKQEDLRREEESRIENERLKALHEKRMNSLLPFWDFVDDKWKEENLAEVSDEKWMELFAAATNKKQEYEAEQEKIRLDNERLQKEVEAKEKQIAEEKAKAEAEAEKECKVADAKLKAEREARAKAEKELQDKVDAAKRIEKEAAEKAEKERKEKEEAERRAKAAPDKNKLAEFAKQLQILELPELTTDDGKQILTQAKVLLGKTAQYITEKLQTL